MSGEEQNVFSYLQNWPTAFISSQEISKRLDRKRFQKDGDWARPLLHRMADQQLLEKDASGGYKIKEKPQPKLENQPSRD